MNSTDIPVSKTEQEEVELAKHNAREKERIQREMLLGRRPRPQPVTFSERLRRKDQFKNLVAMRNKIKAK